MAISIIFILTAIILLLVIPVTIGIFVYRDARRRGMSAMLWALAAALIPTFIGLIIYLIVASERTAKKCAACGGGVSKDNSVCPHCGATLRMNCPTCAYPLEMDWTVCPHCGAEIPEELRRPLILDAEPGKEKLSDKKVGLIIGLVVAIPVLLCILLILMLSLFGIRSSQSSADYGECTVDNFAEKDYVQQWIDECDEKGAGIYLLTDGADYDSKNHSMSYVAYNNTPDVTADWAFESGGFFDRSGHVTLHYVNLPDGEQNHSLSCYVVSSTGRIKDIEIFDQNGELVKNADIQISDLPLCEDMCMQNGFSVSFEDIPDIDKTRIAVEVSGQDTDIFSIEATQYDLQGNAFSSQGVSNADGTCFNGRATFEFVKGIDGGELSSVVFEACDADGALVASSDNIVCGYGEQFKLRLERDANQQWQFVLSDEPYVDNTADYE